MDLYVFFFFLIDICVLISIWGKEYQGFKDLSILVLDVFTGEKFSMGYVQMAAWKPGEEIPIGLAVCK